MHKKELGLALLILVIGGVSAAINPQFVSHVNLSNLANQIGLFGLVALGEGLVVITGGIDLSIGSMLALLGVIFLDLLTNHDVAWPIALLVVVAGGGLLGLVHGLLITRLKLQPFIVTLCGLLLYRGIARYYTADATEGFGYASNTDLLEWITSGRTLGVPHTLILLLLVAAVAFLLLHRSMFGRYLFAVGRNEEAARYSGIATDRVVTMAYVLAGLLTGISAVTFVFYTQSVSPSNYGNFYELYAIAAAVLGGCTLRGGEGSVVGIVLGMVLLQMLQNLVNILGIPSSLNFAVMGAVILLGIIADRELRLRRQARLARASAEARGTGRPTAAKALAGG